MALLMVLLAYPTAPQQPEKYRPHFQMKSVRCDINDGKLANCSLYPGETLDTALQEVVQAYSANCDDDGIDGPED